MLTISTLAFVLFSAGCNNPHQAGLVDRFAYTTEDSINALQYEISNYFDQTMIDSLLVTAVTYIGRKPVMATSFTRFDQEFRAYYVGYAPQFSFFLYHISPDSLHSFYMIRPARSLEGNARGVLGQFRMKDEFKLYDFEEILNTRIKPQPELKKIGLILFEELIQKGNVDAMIADTSMVEWPDGRLKYHKEMHEWRYDVE